jgi:murein DD-endopeptidase MepM/ murein hydrolase activator NlpD
MTNSGRYFIFLFSRNNKTKISIKRVEVRKGLLQYGSLAILFALASTALGIGIFGVSSGSLPDFASLTSSTDKQQLNQVSAQVPVRTTQIDYSRPSSVDEFAHNAGGPFVAPEDDPDAAEVENRLRVIQATSNPATIPAIWAHQGKINNEFGFRRSPFGGRLYEFHGGLDIDGERGQIVIAAATGTVTEAGWKGGYGQMVEIDHGNGLATRYGHLSRVDVQAGQPIARGDLIGLVGSTGRSTGPHLHFELRLGEKPINPRRFLPTEPMELAKLSR